ncbi:MAG: bifunctional phosphoglucose/phosphomannose isomerase [Candidatus Margulisiibacteriota bacterium]
MAEIELLDTKEKVAEIDKGKMLVAVEQVPAMIETALKLPLIGTIEQKLKTKLVVISGMGGSGISGEILADAFPLTCPVTIVKNYSLPDYIDSEATVVAVSYSGETEETLAVVRQAEARGARVVCITSGGKLKEMASQKNWPMVLIPTGFQPRAALMYLFVPLLQVLGRLGVIEEQEAEILRSLPLIKKLRDEYSASNPVRSNPAKQLAKKIAGKIPVIIGSAGTTGAVANRFKNQFNENTKLPAFASVFPEVNHNETASYFAMSRDKYNFALIILRDEADNERIKKRIEITKSLLSQQFGGINEFFSQGKSRFARLASLVLLADFASVYAAILQGIDPTTIEAITRLKKEMSR